MKKSSLFIIFILVLLVGIFIYKNNNKDKNYKYSKDSIERMNTLGIKGDIDLNKYSKTLDTALFDDNLNKDYVDKYELINYIDINNFIDNINYLIDNEVSVDDINNIIDNYMKYDNFDIHNAKRYIDYKSKNKNLKNIDVVTRVNINLDKEFYKDAKLIDDPDNIYTLVNKYNYLSNNFVPKNLKPIFNNNSIMLVDKAADAFEEFINGALNDGYTFIATTGYRSYSFQNQLYTSYVNKDGKEKADTYSARPGYSEHQLGYSVDLKDPNYSPSRLSAKDYEWVKNNAYKYGFILRYTKDSEDITGYMEESWHIRYVGKDVAKDIYDKNITYDEYYDRYLKKNY